MSSNQFNTSPALELGNRVTQVETTPSTTVPMPQSQFLDQVTITKSHLSVLSTSLSHLHSSHQRAFASPNFSFSESDALSTSATSLTHEITAEIKLLNSEAFRDPQNSIKATQARALKREFERVLKGFQDEEIQYRVRLRCVQRRQWKIVNPGASEAELEALADSEASSEGGIFAQALLSGNRAGNSRMVLSNIQARHEEIMRMEKTLIELAAMFDELMSIVDVHEHMVESVEVNAVEAGEYLDKGNGQLGKAIWSARNWRRGQWWCLLTGILIVSLVALAVVLALKPWVH